ncbi:WXG100 family type VII secretion target [Streptomyces marianii]|uniref:WXG100 family type VII secretion target n=1 Tax=Streptomyces marianii TaxID=1817406 RepID=A0A5R9E097_9ACTN|nr:hypothetical protein [Streptomyces marianii]TLQ43361.1 hypothetical protein FEF34_09610 [Streptomyces marianii]
MAGSEFEGKSLDALYAMIASAKPGELTAVGDALEAAVPEIINIATDLRLYIDNVKWQGEGGDAFRVWGADMVSETLRLGDFTQVVASEMQRAGQALSEAKQAVPKPAGMCFADPEKEEARIEAETGPKLQEAIHQLERLSSYYQTTQDRIAAEPEPEFKPLEAQRSGERAYGTGVGAGSTYSSGAASYGGAQYSTTEAVSASSTSRGHATEQGIRPSAPPSAPEASVGTSLDSVGTLPPEPAVRPGQQVPTVPPMAGGPSTPPGPLLPPVAPVVGPQTGGGPSRAPSVPGGIGGPRGTGPLGALPPRVGGGEGIVGGKQMSGRASGSIGPRLPMGTVVGEERAGFGRGTGMPGYGAGMQGAPGVGTGAGGGRRLASQPGGTIGASAASGISGRGAFTPGGSGLVRPPGSTTSSQEDRRASAARPDYLSEDEETWAMGQRKIVPPVID